MDSSWRELVIVRKRWARAKEVYARNELNQLHHRVSHKQCCLGFECRALGIPLKEIVDIGNPYRVAENTKSNQVRDILKTNGLITINDLDPTLIEDSKWTTTAIIINDSDRLSESDREAKLALHFAKRKVRVRFV